MTLPETQLFPATLFDYNGVLVDDEAVHLAAFRDTLAPYGITLSDEDYVDRYLGFDDRGAFAAIFADHGRPLAPDELERLVEEKRPHYLGRAAEHLPTFPGASELVRRRAAAGPVAIVSGALREEILLGLAVLDVQAHVAHVISAEDTRACKPDPEGYQLGIERLTREVGERRARLALVVEDSLAGVQAAKAAGLTCAAVAHSYPIAALERAGADLVVPTLQALTDELLRDAFRRIHG
ncbi:MAG TPA: HAD family phosphatase [Polyangiaceae bacterium]|nr:HAD family phosphatase [Polyangiaceae bacterium]